MAEPVNDNVNTSRHLIQVGRTNLCLPVALKHQCQRREIDKRENVLRSLNVLPHVCEPVQLLVDPDMCAGVHERACTANNLFVVSFALEVDLNLLHVCSPVDFGIWQVSVVVTGTRVLVMARTSNFLNDDAAQAGVCDQQQGRYPFRVPWVGSYIAGLIDERHGAGKIVVVVVGICRSHIGKVRSRV
jgi:hypothetical protein